MKILPIAAPSCILPDTVAANAFFLASKVQEVGLYFFESQACLNYTEVDLPQNLANLPINWHIHLPVDLPWGMDDGSKAARIALNVAAKAAYLNPRFGVLHPPTHINGHIVTEARQQEKFLLSFIKTWYTHTNLPILLENIEYAPLVNLGTKLFNLPHMPIGICLDVGHMLGFNQHEMLLQSELLKHVSLVHWSAPGKRDEHLALNYFTAHEYEVVQNMVQQLPHGVCHMLEIFNWSGIEQSYAILEQILDLRP